jgi:hypothetical protein
MNHVHPRNDPAAFDKFHHYIVTFEDSTFECIAQSYAVLIAELASENEVHGRMLDMVRARDEKIQSEFQRLPDKPQFTARIRWWTNALNPWSRYYIRA